MACLVDTSIVARLANTADALYPVATHAVVQLHQRGEQMYVTAQNLIEFRNVATRPKALNGLGLNVADAEAKSAVFETQFPLLDETPQIYPTWKSLVHALGIIGKRVHDARLVAVCQVHAVTNLLTFNVPHFVGMATVTPGLIVLDPATV